MRTPRLPPGPGMLRSSTLPMGVSVLRKMASFIVARAACGPISQLLGSFNAAIWSRSALTFLSNDIVSPDLFRVQNRADGFCRARQCRMCLRQKRLHVDEAMDHAVMIFDDDLHSGRL